VDIEFTGIARTNMADRGIHRLEVEAVLTSPDQVEEGEVVIRYEGRIADRTIVVFVVRDSEPPTVMFVRGGAE
jgi:hypothetical protein